MRQGLMHAVRNEGSGSSLTQWSWAGSDILSVSRLTPNRKSKKDQACFQGFAELPPGD